MGKKSNINDLFKSKYSLLISKLKTELEHPVTKGENCEYAWIDFLRGILPSRYAVDKGFVFDYKGGISDQIDIIIYDALYSPIIFETASGEKYVTAESVYAVFDSKQEINKKNFEETNKKIQSVLGLHRTKRDILNGGKPQGARDLTHIIGGILAKKSVKFDTIKKYMEKNTNIAIGCALEKLSFVVYMTPNDFRDKQFYFQENESKDKSDKVTDEEVNVLVNFFYGLIDKLFRLGTVAAIDIREYARNINSISLPDDVKFKGYI
jgi:hypothetical protein